MRQYTRQDTQHVAWLSCFHLTRAVEPFDTADNDDILCFFKRKNEEQRLLLNLLLNLMKCKNDGKWRGEQENKFFRYKTIWSVAQKKVNQKR